MFRDLDLGCRFRGFRVQGLHVFLKKWAPFYTLYRSPKETPIVGSPPSKEQFVVASWSPPNEECPQQPVGCI